MGNLKQYQQRQAKQQKPQWSVELAVKWKALEWDEQEQRSKEQAGKTTVTSTFILGDSPTAASVLAHLQRHRIQQMEGVIRVFQFQPRAVERSIKFTHCKINSNDI